jgi:hypothetical protein
MNGNGMSDRDERGLFRPGNTVSKGVGGNPDAKLKSQYKRALMEAGSPERVKQLVDAMFVAACDGDTAAGKVLLDHWVGRPSQSIEVTSAGEAPIQTDITAIVAIIQQEEPDPDRRLKIARRILSLGQQPAEQPDGPVDGNGADA